MESLASTAVRAITETPRTGPMHMALEEAAAETAARDNLATVRTFRWQPSTLSMGYGQHEETVDWAFCEANEIDVTRRQTGGGGIYHDTYGDISYTIVVPKAVVSGDLLEAYHTLCTPIISYLDRLGIDADFAGAEHEAIYEPACFLRGIHPAHDILVDGRKISGNAQYRQKEAVIQHGSILFEQNAQPHLGVFTDDAITQRQLLDRTTTINEHVNIDRDRAVKVLHEELCAWADADLGQWRQSELELATELAEEKYDSPGWVRGPSGGESP